MKTAKYFMFVMLLASMFLAACGGAAPTQAPAGGSTPAAGGQQPATGEKVNLVYWSMWNEPEPQAKVIAQWITDFQAANPNITITPVWNGRENQTKVRTALGTGTKIDLVDQDADQLAGGMVAEGLGYPLDDLANMTALDENVPLKDVFTPGVLDLFQKDGHYYLWPYVNNPVMFWYNKDIFTSAGVQPPTTWDEFLAAAQKIKDSGKAVLAVEGDTADYNVFFYNYLVERLKGKGFMMKAIEDKTGEMWKDPAFAQALQMQRDLWDKGYIPAESAGYVWPAGQQTLATGEAAMELCGGWLPTELKDTAGPDFKWGGFKFPTISGGVGGIDDLHSWLLSFMILKDSAHPKEATQFLQFIMTKTAQQQMADQALVGVTRKGVQWPAALADGQAASESAKVTITHADGGTAYHPEYTKNILFTNYMNGFLGKLSPADFAAKMAADSKTYWETHDK